MLRAAARKTRLITGYCAVAVALVASGAAIAAVNPQKASEYYENALEYFNGKDYAQAVIELKNALQADPRSLPARVLLGRVYVRIHDGASAEKELIRARRSGADNELTLVPLAHAYLMQQKFEALLDEIDIAGQGPEITGEVRILQGNAHLELRDLDKAEAAFAEASRLLPENAIAHLSMAKVHMHRAEFEAAEALLTTAAALAPNEAEVWFAKGELHRLAGDFEAAVSDYDVALELSPDHIETRINRAAVYIDLKRDDDAFADIKYAASIIPNDPQVAYLYGLILMRSGDLSEAEAVMTEALIMLSSRDPSLLLRHPPSLLLGGVLNYIQQNHEAAVRYLQRYVKLVPNHVDARRMLGGVYLQTGEPSLAIGVLRPAVRLSPGDAKLQALLGEAYTDNGQYGEATRILQNAVKLAPDLVRIRTQLAQTRLASGASRDAVKQLKAAMAADPEALRPGLILTSYYLHRRRFDEAIEVARSVAERAPDNPLPQNLMAAAYLGKGDRKEARKRFNRAIELNPNYVPAIFNLGRLDTSEGRLDRAAGRYHAIREIDPGHGRAMLELAKIAEHQGRMDDAVMWLENYRLAVPDDIDRQLRLVETYLRLELNDKAERLAYEIERAHPNKPEAVLMARRAELAAGMFDKAVPNLRKAAVTLADSAEGLYGVATMQVQALDLAAARDTLRLAVNADPDYLPVQVALVELEAQAGNIEQAREIALHVRDRKPELSIGDLIYGNLLMYEQRYAEAADAYAAGLRKEPSSELVIGFYRARRMDGDSDQAFRVLKAWVRKNPQDLLARQVLATAYIHEGRDATAIKHFERLRAKRPDDPGVLNNLAWLYHNVGDPRALAYAEQAYRLAPNEAATLDTLGWLLVRNGEPARGLTYLRQAQARASNDPRVRHHLAVALNALGKTKQARTELEAALGISTTFEGADEARALLRALNGG